MRNPVRAPLRILLAAALLTAAHTGAAHADDDDWDTLVGDDDDDDSSSASGDSSGDAGDSGDSGAEFGDGLTGGFPSAFVYRPRTLPQGAYQAGLDLTFNTDFTAVGVGSVDAESPTPGGLSFAFGVTDTVEVGATYGFALNDPAPDLGLEPKGTFTVVGAYRWISDEKKQIVPIVSFGYSPRAESVGPVSLGALVQYDLTDRLALFTRPALVVLPGTLDPATGDEVTPVSIEGPVAMGYQVTDRFYAEVSTLAIRINVANRSSGFVLADFFPVSFTGLYTTMGSQLDIGASVSMDLRPAGMAEVGDTVVFSLVGRYRGGL